MRKELIIFGVLLTIIFVAGCATTQESIEVEKTIKQKEEGNMIQKENTGMEKKEYTGNLLAGTTAEYREFTQADYEQAQQEGKTILLYFYASWCPLCKAEQKETFTAFNELTDNDIIGFRVNYKDSDTDADEEALAKEFGISYQHTKVILKDGKRVLKAPDSWDKARYLKEIKKVVV